MEDSKARFDAGAQAWSDYNQKPLGCIRREVTWHNLAPHLPEVTPLEPLPRVLDVGGGSGELALRLLRHGYQVWLLDYAPAMLEQARNAAQALPVDARARFTLCPMAVDDARRAFAPGFFEAITCHTLIEYLSDPRATLGMLTSLLSEGGLLSLSFVNRHSEVLRQVWSRTDPGAALVSLEDGAFCATLFDVPGRAYSVDEAIAWLRDLGLTMTATCGVRAFADFVPRQRLEDAEFYDALLRLELSAAAHSPYNLLARYSHLIAHKGIKPCAP